MVEQNIASIQELERLASVLPEKLGGLTQSFDGVQSAIAALAERIDTRREQVSDVLDQLQAALGNLPEIMGTQHTQLEAEIAALETSLGELEAWGEQSRGLLIAGVGQIKGAISTLVDQSEDNQGTLEELDERVTAGIDSLQTQVQAGQSAFESAMETAYEQAGSFQEALETAQSGIQDHMNDFSEVVGEGQAEVTSQIESLVQTHFSAAGDGMGQNLTNLSGSVIKERVQELLDETQRRIDQELKQQVEETVGDLGDGVTGAVERLMGRQEKMAGDRLSVKALFDEMGFLLGPLQDSADTTIKLLDEKKAAEAVGDTAEEVFEDIGTWLG
ncbi:MAG: hypothetical protein ABG776_11505 [Cyanobacteria bacterium J06555_13]